MPAARCMEHPADIILCQCPARIGLLGNPSDGFGGKTISFTCSNFMAEVSLTPSDGVHVRTNPRHDPGSFASVQDLHVMVQGQGPHGGHRLLLATCKRFVDHCARQSIRLHSRGFTLEYDTSIPRQAGLSGSSAIIGAALACLLAHYHVEDRVPPAVRPALMLSVEQDELGITAGLQDRVVQVYGGLVYMDFDAQYMQEHGRGRYASLDPALLPPLWLIWGEPGSDSGRVHSSVQRRWQQDEGRVRQDMADIAALAEEGRHALEAHDHATLAVLMKRNFELRRLVYGDAALGAASLRMVEVARSVGAAAKFTGSGGAVVALCTGKEQAAALQQACLHAGLHIEAVKCGPALFTA